MANSLTTNPIVLDTVNGSIDGFLSIKTLMYTGATTAGHGFTLKNYNGDKTIMSCKTTASGNVIVPFCDRVNFPEGMKLTAIDSGTLYIYQ
jgi:hypothetical protein